MVEKHDFGLIGKNISYSFSRQYFTEKFHKLDLRGYSYQNFDIATIQEIPKIIKKMPNLKGLNVTIPYKEEVLGLLDEIDQEAEEIGAVNTIKIGNGEKLKGYNTDAYGFENSLKPLLKDWHKNALILGTGGASKAIHYVLNKSGMQTLFVSRHPKKENQISYQQLTKTLFKKYTIIINCTPLGTHPVIEKYPDIPYQYLTEKHLMYDLIYNPSLSLFLKKGKEKGSMTINGLRMLELQAEKAWEIWNS